jgi:1,3-beta-galactosyl-N-acetylhexosamine phosphorylase
MKKNKSMPMNKELSGSFTLPAEAGQEALVKDLVGRWKADYIRDCGGTALSPELLKMGLKVYSTICLVRDDQTWAQTHMDRMPEIFLMSEPITATGSMVQIDPLKGFHREKYLLDTLHNPKEWWEVIDRTTGQVVPTKNWKFDAKIGKVIVRGVKPFHLYTVNTLCWVIWDTTSMYNHITNQWNKPHVVGIDPYFKDGWDHLMTYFDQWLARHSDTDLVRLTTLAYHFALIWDDQSKEKFTDWTGYQETVSVQALNDFEKEYGYRLRSEDFVDQGYYNATCRVPARRWLDWMDFIHRFVVRFGRELVKKCHRAGKKTGIFWGDHWVGVEPYSPQFQKMEIDVHIGAAEDGVAVRRVADAPGPQVKELRFYPYFFPDVFCPGGNPTAESQSNWIKIRRALLREPIDRIGYGGYLSLTKAFPDFIEHVEKLAEEFRLLKVHSGGKASWKPKLKVLILSAWGRRKAWINSLGREQKFLVKRQDVTHVAGTNLLECLSGLPVEVDFADFQDILRKGYLEDINVIINDGDAETAWSGGRHWTNPKVLEILRSFVYRGGGFIGCRGPTAWPYQNRYFQLADVMGVDREMGQGIQNASVKVPSYQKHFITNEPFDSLDFGTPQSFVFVTDPRVQILFTKESHVMLATNTFGKGRSVYLAGLPYSLANSRLLLRSIFWAANQEPQMQKWFSINFQTDCAVWLEAGHFLVVNHTDCPQTTTVISDHNHQYSIKLDPFGYKWCSIKQK